MTTLQYDQMVLHEVTQYHKLRETESPHSCQLMFQLHLQPHPVTAAITVYFEYLTTITMNALTLTDAP